MTYKFEFTPVSKEEAKQMLDAQKILMVYATEGLQILTGMMLETPDLDEFTKTYEMYQDVAQFTKELSNAQSVEETQQLVEQMQKKVSEKLNTLMIDNLQSQLDIFKARAGDK